MREKILTFIEKNSRVDLHDLAVLLGVDEQMVINELEAMEAEHAESPEISNGTAGHDGE